MTAYNRFFKDIGNSFAITCYLNVAFLICFLHRTTIGSFVVLLLLLGSVIRLYKKADISPIRVKERSAEEKEIIREQFNDAHKSVASEIRKEKWERTEAKLNRKNKPLSFLEVLIANVKILSKSTV